MATAIAVTLLVQFFIQLLATTTAFRDPGSILAMNKILPLPEREIYITYILQFDPFYLDVSSSTSPIIIDETSDGGFTCDSSNLELQGMKFNSKQPMGLAVIGRMPAAEFMNVTEVMHSFQEAGADSKAFGQPSCPFRLANIFVVVAESHSSGGPGLEDEIASKPTDFIRRRLERLSHSLLALQYDSRRQLISQADIMCLDCNQTAIVYESHLCMTGNRYDNHCLETVFVEYSEILARHGPCRFGFSPPEVPVESPFHASSSAAFHELGCCVADTIEAYGAPLLSLSHGSYYASLYEYKDAVVQSRSAPLHIISSEAGLLVSGVATNPYVTPFELQVWALLVATVIAMAVIMTATDDRGCRRGTFTKALLGTTGIFLEQVTPGLSRAKRLPPRIALLSLLIGSILLANHYRSVVHSEFTVISETYLNVTCVEDLAGFKIFVLLDGERCRTFREYAKDYHEHEYLAGSIACRNSTREDDECAFVQQADSFLFSSLYQSPFHWKMKENIKRIWDNLTFACINDIPHIVRQSRESGPDVKIAYVSSNANLMTAWTEFVTLMKEFPHMHFGSILGAEDSFFVATYGIRLNMRLASHQEWILRRLRGLMESGVQYLWDKWERMPSRRRNDKERERMLREIQAPRPITSSNDSWILTVFYGWSAAIGFSSIVLWVELQIAM